MNNNKRKTDEWALCSNKHFIEVFKVGTNLANLKQIGKNSTSMNSKGKNSFSHEATYYRCFKC